MAVKIKLHIKANYVTLVKDQKQLSSAVIHHSVTEPLSCYLPASNQPFPVCSSQIRVKRLHFVPEMSGLNSLDYKRVHALFLRRNWSEHSAMYHTVITQKL